MFRMQKRVAEKRDETGDPEIKLLRKMLSHLDGNSAGDAPSASESEPITDSINEMKGVVAEKRSATEALLRELGVIEQRLELQSTVTNLNQTYLSAKERVNQCAAAVERSRERLAAAQRERERAAANRKDADELLTASQSDVQCTTNAVADLERLLEQARGMVEQTTATLREREVRARELAASEGSAEARVTEAQAALVTEEAQLENARHEASDIKERVDALRNEILSQGAGGAFAHVQELARQIADLKRPAAD